MTKNLALSQTLTAVKQRQGLAVASLPVVHRPDFELPEVPLDLAELTDDDMMTLFVQLTRWTDYLAWEFAIAEVEEHSAEVVLEKAKALGLLANWAGGKEDRTTVSKAQAANTPEVVEWQSAYDVAYARRKMTGMLFGKAERDAAVVSRELTRRTGRHDSNSRRADRAGGK